MTLLNPKASAGSVEWVKEVHRQAVKAGLDSNVGIGNCLIKMYASTGSMTDARQVFDKMVLKRDAITWNVIIGAYAHNGHGDEDFELLLAMQQEGLQPDATTYLSILDVCDNPSDLRWVKKVQSQVVSAGLESDLSVGTAFFKVYSKSGKLEDARHIFDKLGNRDAIAWNLMIGAYAKSGHGDEAFKLFLEMQQENPKPDALIY